MHQQRTTSDHVTDHTTERTSQLASLRGYRSRYHAFVQQKMHLPAVPRIPAAQVRKVSQFAQSLTSFAIFLALFLGILTLFGLGLSRMRPHAQSPEPAVTQTTTSVTPPPDQPAGHAQRKKGRK